jgi:uncharacterized protein YjbJ (UPF0337 family)
VTSLTAPFASHAKVDFVLLTSIKGTEMTDKKDLASEGVKDRLKGATKQVEGRIRSTVGGATGDTGEQLKGKGQEIKGRAQQEIGKTKQDLDPEPGVDER